MKKTIIIVSVLVVVFLCTSFPVFADTLNQTENIQQHNTFLDGDLIIDVNSFILPPYLIDYDYNFVIGRTYYGTSNQPYPASAYNWNSSGTTRFYDVPVYITFTVSNRGDYLAYSDSAYIGITPNFSFDYYPDCWYIETPNDDFTIYLISSSGELRLRPTLQDFSYLGRVGFPRSTNYTYSMIVHFLYYYSTGMQNGTTYPQINGTSMNQGDYIDFNSVSLTNPSNWYWSNVDAYNSQNITLWQIKQNILNIYDKLTNRDNAYNSVSNDSATIDSSSSSLETQSNTNHQTELSYFNQTNTALNNSGISNYQFDNEQIGGIGSVSNDFTAVWNSLGSWTSVYIFSLTLSLGLAIIRHVRPIKRSNEE